MLIRKFTSGLLLSTLLVPALAAVTSPARAAEYLLNNPGFEELPVDPNPYNPFGIPGWFNISAVLGNNAIVGTPAVGAQQGNYALELSLNNPAPENPITFVFQRLFVNPNLTASPGEEFYASVRVLRETAPANDALSDALLGIAFFDGGGTADGRIDDMAPSSISKGEPGECPFPGINAVFDDTDNLNTWQQLQSQGVAASMEEIIIDCVVKAPEDATEVGLFLFQRNLTGSPAPIWFDNVILARLEPDDDGDRLENGVDSDPLNVSVDFSDGTTSGSIVADADGILGIDDAPEVVDGVRITSDSGSGAAARVRVCDSSATLSIRPGTDVVTTCGSVILAVAPDSEPVIMEIEFDGEPATIEVPPEITITYKPETGSLAVESSSNNPEPVILTVGETTVSVYPTSIPGFPISIDVKPGGYPNCFNINGKGLIPVAIFGSDLLDVSDVDQTTLNFGGLNLRVKGSGSSSCGQEDSNIDGYLDLVCHFEDDPSLWNPGVTSATLSGELYDGTVISGSDSICIVL